MEKKVFKNGILVGRFQHIHAGHERLINIGLNLCDRLLIYIGSSNAQISKKNPYDYEYRKKIIAKIYQTEILENRIIILPLEDFKDSSELSTKWGKYVISNAQKVLNETPQCIIYGKDKNIFKCFDKSIVKNITEILVNRADYLISATNMRDYLLEDNKTEWQKYANYKIHDEYEDLKDKLKEAVNGGSK